MNNQPVSYLLSLLERELTPEARKSLPPASFVYPEKRKWPIHDMPHARAAVAYANKHLQAGKISKSEFDDVISAVKKRYPKMDISK